MFEIKELLLHFNPFNASCLTLLLFEGPAPCWSKSLFLIFDSYGAQSWAQERQNVSNYKWWVRPVWESVKP